MPWVDATYAAAHWPDAVNLPPATLTQLLTAAEALCAAYAPALAADATPPEAYKLAVVLQAREIRTAALRDAAGQIAAGLTPAPLDPAVRALLRPPAPTGGIG